MIQSNQILDLDGHCLSSGNEQCASFEDHFKIDDSPIILFILRGIYVRLWTWDGIK